MADYQSFSAEGLLNWYCLHLRTGLEIAAARLLSDVCDTYLPVCNVRIGRAREAVVKKPLFPGYAFSRFPLQLKSRVLSCAGVLGILSRRESDRNMWPIPLDDSVISDVRALETAGAIPAKALGVGCLVAVQIGAAKVEGRVVKASDGWSVVVEMPLLGRRVAVPLDSEVCRRIAA